MRFARAVGTHLVLVSTLVFTSLYSTAAIHAASISYGNFGPVPPGVIFLDVKESSGTDAVPLYGAPDPFATGLDFDPTSFVASASGGSLDLTDGQLNFTVMSMLGPGGGFGIKNINLSELGDYTLVGVGTNATQVFAGAVIQAKITQIDGLPVAPIALPSSNASVNFTLIANPGASQPWAMGTGIVIPPLSAPGGGPAKIGATKIEVVINNTLSALSQPASIAFIAKKDFTIGIIPGPHGDIPEPGTAVLMGLAVALLGLVTKRGSR